MHPVVQEITIDAPCHVVWRHLEDAQRRRAWFGHELDLDLVPGSAGADRGPDGDRTLRVDEVEEGRSISYTVGDGRQERSTVTIEVEPEGEGSRVRVTETPQPAVPVETDEVTDRTERSAGPEAALTLLPGGEPDTSTDEPEHVAAPVRPHELVVAPRALAA